MDWFEITILVMCVVAVVSSPVVLVRAFRRRDKARIFDVALSGGFLAYIGVQTFWLPVTQHPPAYDRWLTDALMLLVFANSFGLSRRLFKTPGTDSRTPPA